MIKLTEDDMMIIKGEDNGGYDYKLQFCSLEGYECQWKKEQAEELKQQILNNNRIVEEFRKLEDDYFINYSLRMAIRKILGDLAK
ncbi:MAG: hypothetical protein ACR2LL_08710 [Nitrosopumilus sp.]